MWELDSAQLVMCTFRAPIFFYLCGLYLPEVSRAFVGKEVKGGRLLVAVEFKGRLVTCSTFRLPRSSSTLHQFLLRHCQQTCKTYSFLHLVPTLAMVSGNIVLYSILTDIATVWFRFSTFNRSPFFVSGSKATWGSDSVLISKVSHRKSERLIWLGNE